jgi:hypothetical protein
VDVKDPLQFKARRIATASRLLRAWDKYVRKMPALKTKDIRIHLRRWGNRRRSLGNGPAAELQAANRDADALSYALVARTVSPLR